MNKMCCLRSIFFYLLQVSALLIRVERGCLLYRWNATNERVLVCIQTLGTASKDRIFSNKETISLISVRYLIAVFIIITRLAVITIQNTLYTNHVQFELNPEEEAVKSSNM